MSIKDPRLWRGLFFVGHHINNPLKPFTVKGFMFSLPPYPYDEELFFDLQALNGRLTFTSSISHSGYTARESTLTTFPYSPYDCLPFVCLPQRVLGINKHVNT